MKLKIVLFFLISYLPLSSQIGQRIVYGITKQTKAFPQKDDVAFHGGIFYKKNYSQISVSYGYYLSPELYSVYSKKYRAPSPILPPARIYELNIWRKRYSIGVWIRRPGGIEKVVSGQC